MFYASRLACYSTFYARKKHELLPKSITASFDEQKYASWNIEKNLQHQQQQQKRCFDAFFSDLVSFFSPCSSALLTYIR